MRKHFVILLICMCGVISATAQTVITGHVKDARTNEPLIGVNIVLKGNTSTGVISDLDGNFSLNASKDATLVASFIGYATKEVSLVGKTKVEIALSEDSKALDEVVVVGYGVQKKVNLTGAVSQMKMDEVVADRPVASIADALVGNMPGLTLSNNSGEPGAGFDFQIRGTSSINGGTPLILVDNIAMDISSLNPNDIESISVLKDASAAAIYGARAAFGVILVTTKKSAKEKKATFTYSGKVTTSNAQSLPDRATPLETVQAFKDAGFVNMSFGQNVDKWLGYLNEYQNGSYPEGYVIDGTTRYSLAETDVTKELLGTGFQQIHDISVSGGTAKTTYRLSAGILDQNGVLKTNKDSYNRFNISSFISSDVTSWLTTQMTVFYSHDKKQDPYTLSVTGRPIWGQITYCPSYYPTGGMELDGTYYPYATPYNMLLSVEPDVTKYDKLNLLGRVIFKPVKDLSITAEYAINKTFSSATVYNKASTFINGHDFQLAATDTKKSAYRSQKSDSEYNVLNAFATYNKTFSDHSFTFMAGVNAEYNYYEDLWARRDDMINDQLPSIGQSVGVLTAGDNFSEYSIFGSFYRLNYSYKDRYLFETSGRYDGSSKFPKGNRFGFFPSFSAGWRISEEMFMKKLNPVLTNLKLRASWGSIGNQNINPYSYLSTMSSDNANWLIKGEKPITLNTPRLVRSNFSWERVQTINVGLDFGLFNNRLNGSFDVFNRRTLDMLGPGADYPKTLGAGAPQQNSADMESNGWELQMSWQDRIGQVFYSVGFNLSDARSKITKYKNETKSLSMAYYEGKDLGEIWGYTTDRLYTVDDFVEGSFQDKENLKGGTLKPGIPYFTGSNPNPGDIMYKYADEDGKVWNHNNTVDDPGARRIIGNSTPRYNFGINGSVSWKGLSLSFLLQGVGKRDLQMLNGYTWPMPAGFNYALYKSTLDYWTKDNLNAFYPRLYENSGGNTGINNQVQTRYLKNGAYLDIKSVVLSYELPRTIISKWGLSSLSFFVNGENLYSFNHLSKGTHPASTIRGLGTDFSTTAGGSTYPVMRMFTGGINVTF